MEELVFRISFFHQDYYFYSQLRFKTILIGSFDFIILTEDQLQKMDCDILLTTEYIAIKLLLKR